MGTKLTIDDIERATEETDEAGYFGYATSKSLSARVRVELDKAVLQVANARGLSYSDLVIWMSDKNARWLVDLVADEAANLRKMNDGKADADLVVATARLGHADKYLPGKPLYTDSVRGR